MANDLKLMTRFYNKRTSYVVLDFRNYDEFGDAMRQLGQVKFFQALLDTEPLENEEVEFYAISLLNEIRGDEKVRNTGQQGAGKKSGVVDDILLVFPFDAGEEALDKAGKDLNEASIACDEKCSVGNGNNTKKRAHYLTVCQADRDRLNHGVFLNDTLADFWMQW